MLSLAAINGRVIKLSVRVLPCSGAGMARAAAKQMAAKGMEYNTNGEVAGFLRALPERVLPVMPVSVGATSFIERMFRCFIKKAIRQKKNT